MSDDPGIRSFHPRADPRHDSPEALVWAIDDAHLPAYWFPRECPRGTFWAVERTTDADVERFLTGNRGLRVQAIQADWLDRFRDARLYAYRLPADTFERYERAGGYHVSREPVTPLERRELTDLTRLHADAGIELRIVPDLAALWARVIDSSLEFSGIRLRNLKG